MKPMRGLNSRPTLVPSNLKEVNASLLFSNSFGSGTRIGFDVDFDAIEDVPDTAGVGLSTIEKNVNLQVVATNQNGENLQVDVLLDGRDTDAGGIRHVLDGIEIDVEADPGAGAEAVREAQDRPGCLGFVPLRDREGLSDGLGSLGDREGLILARAAR